MGMRMKAERVEAMDPPRMARATREWSASSIGEEAATINVMSIVDRRPPCQTGINRAGWRKKHHPDRHGDN